MRDLSPEQEEIEIERAFVIFPAALFYNLRLMNRRVLSTTLSTTQSDFIAEFFEVHYCGGVIII